MVKLLELRPRQREHFQDFVAEVVDDFDRHPAARAANGRLVVPVSFDHSASSISARSAFLSCQARFTGFVWRYRQKPSGAIRTRK